MHHETPPAAFSSLPHLLRRGSDQIPLAFLSDWCLDEWPIIILSRVCARIFGCVWERFTLFTPEARDLPERLPQLLLLDLSLRWWFVSQREELPVWHCIHFSCDSSINQSFRLKCRLMDPKVLPSPVKRKRSKKENAEEDGNRDGKRQVTCRLIRRTAVKENVKKISFRGWTYQNRRVLRLFDGSTSWGCSPGPSENFHSFMQVVAPMCAWTIS